MSAAGFSSSLTTGVTRRVKCSSYQLPRKKLLTSLYRRVFNTTSHSAVKSEINLVMNVRTRNNVQIIGSGPTVIMFAHGFGCDQNMWRYLTPSFQDRFTLVLFDLVGSGKSDLSAYDFKKYNSLHGYATDLIEIINEVTEKPIIFIGHSVSATIA